MTVCARSYKVLLLLWITGMLSVCVVSLDTDVPRCSHGEPYRNGTENSVFRWKFTAATLFQDFFAPATRCPEDYVRGHTRTHFHCCPKPWLSYNCAGTQPNAGSPCGLPSGVFWYHDSQTGACQTFDYLGCGGSSNHFFTKQQCESYCNSYKSASTSTAAAESTSSSASVRCFDGEPAYMVGTVPMYCNPTSQWTCPKGYHCKQGASTLLSICCGHKEEDDFKCPTNRRAYKLGSSLRFCSLSSVTTNLCPPNYGCERAIMKSSNSHDLSICCSLESFEPVTEPIPVDYNPVTSCPSGWSGLPSSTYSGTTRSCDLRNGQRDCPVDYLCVAATTGFLSVCCQRPPVQRSMCASGSTAYVNYRGTPGFCTVGSTPCPYGYACTRGIGYGNVHFCCSTTATQSPFEIDFMSTKNRYPGPGEGCWYENCKGGSYCDSRTLKCRCPSNTSSYNGGECRRQPALVDLFPGSSCAAAHAVCRGGSFCIAGICTCPNTTTVRNNQCVRQLRQAEPGHLCSDETVCTKGSKCELGRCMCPRGQMAKNHICVSIPGIQEDEPHVSPKANACQRYHGVHSQPFRSKYSSNELLTCSDTIDCPHAHICTEVTSATAEGTAGPARICCSQLDPRIYHSAVICVLAPDRGTEDGCAATGYGLYNIRVQQYRWYFNTGEQKCALFPYHGCDGNANNFESKAKCEQKCQMKNDFVTNALGTDTLESSFLSGLLSPKSEKLCPLGLLPSINPKTGSPQVCTGDAGVCSSGFSCTYSVYMALDYCCPAPPTASAPDSSCPMGLQSTPLNRLTRGKMRMRSVKRKSLGDGTSEADLCSVGKGRNDCEVDGALCLFSPRWRRFQCCGGEGANMPKERQPSTYPHRPSLGDLIIER